MYYVPQTPCCTPQPIATPCGGDPCSAQPIGSQSVVYSGPNLPCTGIQTCNNLSVAFQKVDEKICDLQDQIDILVNALNVCCTTTTTTSTSTSSTTTTTTTIACPECTFYSVSNENITPATVNYYACGGVYTSAVVGAFGTIYICACTGSVVVPPLPGITLSTLGDCPTTTTTTSSSSTTTTTTSTSSTTTTTTTICNSSTVVVQNDSITDAFNITSVTVNGIPVSFQVGNNFPIGPSQGGAFTTGEFGLTTVVICYSSYSGPTKSISITDCSSPTNTQCCPQSPEVLNPEGGCCTFTNVNIVCGCGVTIVASDTPCD